MKLDLKVVAVLLVVASGLVVVSYNVGQNNAVLSVPDKSAPTIPIADNSARPTDHPSAQASNATSFDLGQPSLEKNAKLMHFKVGNRNVKSMYADGKIVWIGTSGGVIRYDTDTDAYELYDNKTSGLLSNGVFHVSKLGKRIIAGTYGGGLSVLDVTTKKWKNINIPDGLADQFVYDVEQAPNGDVWVATWSGANRIRGGDLDNPAAWESFTVENTQGGLPNPWVYGVEVGANGDVWFATESGLARYKDGVWKNWQHKDGLGAPFEVVRDAIQFTSDPAKASKHHAQQKSEQGLDSVDVAYNPNYIISLKVDKDGVVWCGTWGGGLARFDGKTWRNYTTTDGLPGNHIFMLYIDPQNTLWAGTSRGLAKVSSANAKFSVLTTKDGLFADNVFSMANASDGSVWIGSFGGVARLDKAL